MLVHCQRPPYTSPSVDSIDTTRYRAASGNGVTSRTSNGVGPATPLSQSTNLVMELSRSNVPRAHTQDGTSRKGGKMRPRTKRMYLHFPFSQPSVTIHHIS